MFFCTFALIEMKTIQQTSQEGYIKDGMNSLEHFVKRLFDIVVSIMCLFVFSPLFLFCYICIKLEDGGKAIDTMADIYLYSQRKEILKS